MLLWLEMGVEGCMGCVWGVLEWDNNKKGYWVLVGEGVYGYACLCVYGRENSRYVMYGIGL